MEDSLFVWYGTNKLKRQHWITIPQQDMKQYSIHYNTRHSNLDKFLVVKRARCQCLCYKVYGN